MVGLADKLEDGLSTFRVPVSVARKGALALESATPSLKEKARRLQDTQNTFDEVACEVSSVVLDCVHTGGCCCGYGGEAYKF